MTTIAESFHYCDISIKPSMADYAVDNDTLFPCDNSYAYNYDGESVFLNSSLPIVHPVVKAIVCLVYSLNIIICGIGTTVLIFILLSFRDMRTAPNMLIANLAASDFLVAVFSTPFNAIYYMKQSWPFNKNVCIATAYVKCVSLFVSTNSLVLIAIDRYFNIVSSRIRQSRKRCLIAKVATISNWVISIVIVTPIVMFTDVIPFYDRDRVSYFCGEFWLYKKIIWLKVYDMLIVFGEFIVPIAIMCFCYIRIGNNMSNSRHPSRRNKSRMRTVRLFVIIVIIFVCCWLPYYAYTVFRDFFPLIYNEYVHSITIFYVVEAIAVSNSMANTIVYVGMNKNMLRKIRKLPSELRMLNCFPRRNVLTNHACTPNH
ncbi:prokineticin receptor 2-like [Saccoglossus kowalevskii]